MQVHESMNPETVQAPIFINPEDVTIIAPVFATFTQLHAVVKGFWQQNDIEDPFPFEAVEGPEAIEIRLIGDWQIVWYHPKPKMKTNIITPKLIIPE